MCDAVEIPRVGVRAAEKQTLLDKDCQAEMLGESGLKLNRESKDKPTDLSMIGINLWFLAGKLSLNNHHVDHATADLWRYPSCLPLVACLPPGEARPSSLCFLMTKGTWQHAFS